MFSKIFWKVQIVMLRWNILQYLTKILRQYFNCNEILESFLTFFCSILCYVLFRFFFFLVIFRGKFMDNRWSYSKLSRNVLEVGWEKIVRGGREVLKEQCHASNHLRACVTVVQAFYRRLLARIYLARVYGTGMAVSSLSLSLWLENSCICRAAWERNEPVHWII